MHPALSVIVFTTLSGAGYGLLFLIGVLSGTAILPIPDCQSLLGVTTMPIHTVVPFRRSRSSSVFAHVSKSVSLGLVRPRG